MNRRLTRYLGLKQTGLMLVCLLLIAGAVALAAPTELSEMTSSDAGEFGQAAVHPECRVSDCGDVVVKLEKQYEKWGQVKRPGVVMPVTTLYNTHTKETLPIFENPAVKPSLLRHFFRCRGFGETIDMAPELLTTIVDAARHFKAVRVTVISGYRSPKFNDTLAKKGRRVATESRHMEGQAVDFRLDTVTADVLGPWLREHFEGGVGTYRGDNFVHIDVGPKRSWQGH